MTRSIVPLVKGQSEVEGVPVLLRRILQALQALEVGVARPFRIRRTRIARGGELQRALTQAMRTRPNPGAFLILVDADDDCPVELARDLLESARRSTRLPSAVVVANRELEGWFLGGKESLRGCRGIRPDALAPANPEQIRGAKERLSRNMEAGSYVEVDDQPAFADRVDLALIRERCPSFDKLWREVGRLSEEVRCGAQLIPRRRPSPRRLRERRPALPRYSFQSVSPTTTGGVSRARTRSLKAARPVSRASSRVSSWTWRAASRSS